MKLNFIAIAMYLKIKYKVKASIMKFFPALHIAALHGQAHLVDLLIQHGAVVNASDYLGYTPLHLACQKGYQNIVVRLVWKILF